MASLRFPLRAFASGVLLICGSVRAVTFSYNDPSSILSGISPVVLSTESRNCAQYVLEAYATSAATGTAVPVANIRAALVTLRGMQDLKAGSATYGNFAWDMHDVPPNVAALQVNDQNAGEFVVQALAQAPLRYGALVGQQSDIAASINQILNDALQGINAHSVSSGYTNIAVTKAWNQVALGQYLNNQSELEAGRVTFDNWLNLTRTTGINEFLSPTYYGSDMDSLGFLYLFARDPAISAKAAQALRLFWIDLYANWFAQDQRMSGSHSRTYDYLTDTGSSDRYYYAAGLLTARSQKYWRGMSVTSFLCPPPPDVASLFPTFPRRILRHFNQNAPLDKQLTTNFVNASPGYSVGSLTTRYGDPTSEAMTICLPGNAQTTNINFNVEGRHDPYLQNAVPGKTSVTKAVNLKPFLASVQNAGEVLMLASSDGKDKGSYASYTDCVESSLIFPDEAEIWVGDTRLTITPDASFSVAAGASIFVRYNGVATGVRFLLSTNMSGGSTGLLIVADGHSTDGKSTSFHAKRITCSHTDTTPTSGRGSIAFWSRTAAVADDPAFSAFRTGLMTGAVGAATLDGSGNVVLSVAGSNGTMGVSANVNNQTIASLTGAEPGLGASLLNVNGVEFVPQTLQTWAGQDIGAVGTSGSSVQGSGGTFTVIGAGTDIWGTADSFQFCSQQLQGDGYLIARLVDFPASGFNAWAKAGVMIRETLAAGSTNAYTCLTAGNGQRFSKRTASDIASVRSGDSITTRPVWLKVMRAGNTFTGYSSLDGVNWMLVTPSIDIPMASKVFAGLAVTSFDPSSPIAAHFDNVGVFTGAGVPAPAAAKGYEGFQAQYFSLAQITDPGVAGMLASTGFGSSNLLAYGFGFSPWQNPPSGNGGLPFCALQGGYLSISFSRLISAPDLTYVVEVSPDLVTWNSGAAYTTQTGAVAIDSLRQQVTVRDNQPMATSPNRFMRVRLNYTPP